MALALLFATTAARAETFRFFGSIGGESQLSPANVDSPVTEGEWQGRKAFVLDLAAKDNDIAYSRVQLWIDKASYEPLRADFYVVSGKLIKRAVYRELGQMAGRRVVTSIEIDDLLRPGNRTVMKYANLTQKENPERMFTKDALGKW